MKLLEYEAKAILKSAGIPIPHSFVITKGDPTPEAPIVLKSQVPVGGRGKAGGVRIITEQSDMQNAVSDILSLKIKGFTPTKLLAESTIDIKSEHYISLLIDQASASIRLIAHKNGGVEVEDNDQSGFLSLELTIESIENAGKQLTEHLGYTNPEPLTSLLKKLYVCFVQNDATLLEINPLIFTGTGDFTCGECKMTLDDAATFRHPEWDFEDKPQNTNFVVLDENGSVATIANGAGLAMATVDAVSAAGMQPANFLDIGGGANTERVLAAFNRIMEFANIDAIVINIFAGITRCDEVAKAVIAAKKQIPHLPPLFIRLAGTNFEEAVALLSQEDIPTLATLEECLAAAKEKANA